MSSGQSTIGPAPNQCPEGTRAPSMMHRLWVQLLQAVLGRVDMDPDTAPTELGFFLHPPPPISGPTGLLLPRGRFLSSQRITSFFFLIYLVSFARFLFILFYFFFAAFTPVPSVKWWSSASALLQLLFFLMSLSWVTLVPAYQFQFREPTSKCTPIRVRPCFISSSFAPQISQHPNLVIYPKVR